jgi:TonB family protein
MRRTAVVKAVLLLLVCGVLPPSHARQFKITQQSVTRVQSKWQTFGGKIVSQNDVRFVLKDYDNDFWYHIDDQQKASSFLGKSVLITGTFDGLTGTIRVQNIVEASPEEISAANTERMKQNSPLPPQSVPTPAPNIATGAGGTGRTNPPPQATPPLEARTPPESETPRPSRSEAPITPGSARREPAPNVLTLPEEAVSASPTVAISSRRLVPVPPNFNAQRQPAKNLMVGRLLKRVSPSYPVDAKEQGIEGTVRLHAVISADGNVQSLQPVSGPESLVAAAITAVREWRYGPTLFEGRRIPVQDDIKLVFRLPN